MVLGDQFAILLCLISNFLWLFLVFEIRNNLDLITILVTPKIFVCNWKTCPTAPNGQNLPIQRTQFTAIFFCRSLLKVAFS